MTVLSVTTFAQIGHWSLGGNPSFPPPDGVTGANNFFGTATGNNIAVKMGTSGITRMFMHTDFTICDIYGRIVNLGEQDIKTKYSSDNKITIDISSLSNGIYFVNLKTEQGMVSKKVIINK